MTATEFLELFLSVSLQAAVIVSTTNWIGKLTDDERTHCRLWTVCYSALLLLVVNAAALPHVRMLQPLRPLARPLAADIVSLEMQLGSVLFWMWIAGGAGSLGLFIYHSVQGVKFLRTCQAIDPDVIALPPLSNGQSSGQAVRVGGRAIRLVSTTAITPPFCWQFHEPYIVIPESLLTYEHDDFKYVLRHELAHLHTGHPLQVFLQRTVEFLFWFHPMVWWASREWSLAREFMCDDEAVKSRGDIVRYLKTLLMIVEQTVSEERTNSTLAFVRNRCEMAERARRLVRIAQQNRPAELPAATRRAGFATALLLAVAVVSSSFVWLPVNVLASPNSHWSPWPAWSAGVLNDFGVKARDFEIYDHRYALHEIYDEDCPTESVSSTNNTSPANQPE
tara:strand:+ start:65152 stop:66327 length:1176 start_codon:yes stop_codon:yes gene_type:complete